MKLRLQGPSYILQILESKLRSTGVSFARIFNRISGWMAKQAFAQEQPPQQLGSHPILADLDRDGSMEAVIAFSNRKVRVIRANGANFWPAPYVINDAGCSALYPAVADINSDGNLEIILAEYGADILRILDKNGNLLKFFSGIKAGMPAVADIDNSGDGKMEIAVAKDGVVSLVDSDGRLLWNKTGLTGYTPANSAPVLIDLNGDGSKEIITGDVCVLDKNGNILWSKPATGGAGCSVADLNNDGQVEVISGSGRIFTTGGDLWLQLYNYQPEYPPVIADLDQDNEPEVLVLKNTGEAEVYYDISPGGAKSSAFSYAPYALRHYPPALADIDEDGNPEVVLTADFDTQSKLYFLAFIDSQIELIDTFDVDYKITHTPLIADINQDGIVEIFMADLASERDNRVNYLTIGGSVRGAVFWPQFQHDALRTGLYDIQPPQLSAIGNKTVNAGQSLSFTVSATDQLAGKLSFSAYPLPQGATLINNGNGTATFSWTPVSSQAGTRRLTFLVSDGVFTSSEVVSVNVILDVAMQAIQWGFSGATPVFGDYNGDKIADLAVYAPANGKWYIRSLVSTDPVIAWGVQWGSSTMKPVPGDYNGDGRADLALFDPANGKWYIRSLVSTDPVIAWGVQWGTVSMTPVSGDYNGDGRADLALFDSANGKWYIRSLVSTDPVIAWGVQWGSSTMKPVPGDYNGDGRADLAVYDSANGKWYIKSLTDANPIAWALPWGFKTMIPVPGDYNGDRKAEPVVYDPGDGYWYIGSLTGNIALSALQAPINAALRSIADDAVELTWQPSASTLRLTTGYIVERSTRGGSYSAIARISGSGIVSYTDRGLIPATYDYRIRACNGAGVSPPSNVVSVTVQLPLQFPASVPTNLSVQSIGYGEAKLTWQDNSTDENGFVVESSSDGKKFGGSTVRSNTTSATCHTGVGTFYFRVMAYKGEFINPIYRRYSNTVRTSVRW
jgi:hypothetical protein